MRERAPLFVLLALLFGQWGLFSLAAWPREYGGDEPGYVATAQTFLEGRLPVASESARAAAVGRTGEVRADWHPPGYSLFLAAVNLIQYRPASFRYRAASAQFAMVCVVLIWLHGSVQHFAKQMGATMARRNLVSVLIGIQPWAFQYTRTLLVESLAASVTTAGLLGLLRFSRRPEGGALRWLFASGALVGFGLLLRPEMIALTPFPFVLALALKRPSGPQMTRAIAGLGLIWLFFLTAQVYYRWHLVGRAEVYGRFVFPERGALDWVHSWLGTERDVYDFFYSVASGVPPPKPPPDRAFANPAERAEIEGAIGLIRACACYSGEANRIFAAVAAERIHNDWMGAYLLPRMGRTLQLWLNLETSNQLLAALVGLRRGMRALILGSLMALKAAVFLLALAAAWLGWRSWRDQRFRSVNEATLLMFGWVVARTLLIGMVLGFGIERYVHPAWPALLWCAGIGVIRIQRFRADGRVDLTAIPPVVQTRGSA